MTIVNRIGEVCREQNLNIKQLADKAEVAYNTAHDLYTGRVSRIGLEVLDRVCRVLQTQPGELLVWVDDKSDNLKIESSN
jgi:putative transcriptional regulator